MIGTSLFALGRWYTQPASKTPSGTLLDQFLPDADPTLTTAQV
jgi:hypothetical protein